MAHFARIDDNVVQEVIAVSNDDCGGGVFPESEPLGQDFIKKIGLEGVWIQVSYNSSFRKRFPSKGFYYDPDADIFVPPKPYNSWLINDDFDWEPPKPYPQDGQEYRWDDIQQEWVTMDFLPPGVIESMQD